MTTLVTLFEHRPISYNLGKKEDYDVVTQHLTLTQDTIDALDQLNESVKFLEITRSVITPQNFVGVVKTEHLTFQIFPKLFADSQLESHIDVIAGNLLQMLSYSGKLATPDIDISSLSTEDTDLFEIFIYIFAKKLNELIRLTQKKQYIERNEELRFIKGRIDIRNYGNPARLHIIPCDYYDFTIDNPLNRVLKYTCYVPE